MTRSRIIATAAKIMGVQGVDATTLDDVMSASSVSKSQLYRHFAHKSALVRAVIEFVGARTIADERERLGSVQTLADLQQWRDRLLMNSAGHYRYGCPLGALASAVSNQDQVAREKLHEVFTAWRELFEGLLRRFQQDGIIPEETDVVQLAAGFVASIQGGYLLAQTSRDVIPMASAIDMAIGHLQLLARVRS
jgi:TetR/AcrR family transcriptional repressor of nem operon